MSTDKGQHVESMVRWGVPLTLLATYLVFGDARASTPSEMAHHALDAVRDTLLGLIPKFF